MKHPVFLFVLGAIVGGIIYAIYLKQTKPSISGRLNPKDLCTRIGGSYVFNGGTGQYECIIKDAA